MLNKTFDNDIVCVGEYGSSAGPFTPFGALPSGVTCRYSVASELVSLVGEEPTPLEIDDTA